MQDDSPTSGQIQQVRGQPRRRVDGQPTIACQLDPVIPRQTCGRRPGRFHRRTCCRLLARRESLGESLDQQPGRRGIRADRTTKRRRHIGVNECQHSRLGTHPDSPHRSRLRGGTIPRPLSSGPPAARAGHRWWRPAGSEAIRSLVAPRLTAPGTRHANAFDLGIGRSNSMEHSAVTWSLHAIALHKAADEGLFEWAAAASSSRGVPDRAPTPIPLPFSHGRSDCLPRRGLPRYGTVPFTVADVNAAPPLTEVPGIPAHVRVPADLTSARSVCAPSANPTPDWQCHPPPPSRPSHSANRPASPYSTAIYKLSSTAGPQLIFDDSADRVFVIRPDEPTEDLVREWPW